MHLPWFQYRVADLPRMMQDVNRPRDCGRMSYMIIVNHLLTVTYTSRLEAVRRRSRPAVNNGSNVIIIVRGQLLCLYPTISDLVGQ